MKLGNNIRNIFRFGLLLFFFNAFSQHHHPLIKYYDGELKLNEKQVDSLTDQVLAKSESDYMIALALYQKGVLHRKRGNDVVAIKKYGHSLEYLETADTTDVYLHSALWRNQAIILYNYKLFNAAANCYEKALPTSYQYSTRRGFDTEYSYALSLTQVNPEKAIDVFDQLKSKAEKDTITLARVLNQLGIHQKRLKNHKAAITYFEDALNLGIQGRTQSLLYHNLSDAYHRLEDYSMQEKMLLKALEIPRANKFLSLLDLGECYILQERKEEAKAVLMEALSIYDKQQLKREHLKLFDWLNIVVDNPTIYNNRLVQEQEKFLWRMDTLRNMMEIVSIRNLNETIEAKEQTTFFRNLSIAGGGLALITLLTWRIWWYRLRRRLNKKIFHLVDGWDDTMA